jgi:hypothetical protein
LAFAATFSPAPRKPLTRWFLLASLILLLLSALTWPRAGTTPIKPLQPSTSLID